MSAEFRSALNRRLSRRRVLKAGAFGALGVTAMAALACGGDDESSGTPGGGTGNGGSSGGTSPTTSPGSSSGDEIKRGGNLELAWTSDLASLNPHAGISSNPRQRLFLIYNTLTKLDHNLDPQPQLAEDWELADEGATVVLKLRPGVTFHNGREFTSEDVRWNFERAKEPQTSTATFRLLSGWFPIIETPDPYTAVLKSEVPRGATFDLFHIFHLGDSVTGEGPNSETTAVGTGPFKFVEWRQGEQLKLARNADYWDGDRPYVDEITWHLSMGAETMLAQFESGVLHGLDGPAINGFVRYQTDSNYQTLIHPVPGSMYLNGFNTQIAPFNDKRVRQAFNWATDRQRFVDVILKGVGEPFSLPWPEGSYAYDDVKRQFYTFDLQKAADLMRAANVTEINTEVVTRPDQPEIYDFVAMWQNDLREIGVNMSIHNMEGAAFGAAINSLDYNAAYAASSNNAGFRAPGCFYMGQGVWGGAGQNNTGFQHDRYQELIVESSVTLDPERLRQIYSEINDILLDESHIQSTASQPLRLALASNVRGVEHDIWDNYNYIGAWLA